ncbi:uncharacterized protein MONOS_2243 [Monocercomonoides exilis]|uniref:uncharacterized protein n=1 Tax=Monocercomonoides exilis TaxID=2049356 RepID=UPI003559FC04|nr:hypothetical protein MONOS_2243 [Monocercomonoides exilis]|eukprot:MONOS_2243.1-p1 / transcript=MONOS_2243.1 / gene=MONOS_2243 / organism=Monocercomonoides_exilis_PA203 / gene_product=unspecified product / transcript_product=unspecified product / location=Mono_scaffold00045:53752-55343(-) / protein_length=346 / sequence_SO=supercontig / SO=protein_coding / is_pseudo=false
MEFCKVGSIIINDDILNTFIPETEKNFFTRHTDASWNAFAVTKVTAEGRKDSPEAARVIELLQPALESGLRLCPLQEWTLKEEQHRQERSRLRLQETPKAWLRWELHEFQGKKEINTSPTTACPSISWESGLDHSSPPPSFPEYTGRTCNRHSFWIEPMGLEEVRGKVVALCCETEKEERAALRRENSEEALSPSDREKMKDQEIPRDHETETWRENTEEDSAYPRVMKQRSEIFFEKRTGRGKGELKRTIVDNHKGEENTQIQNGIRTPEVRRRVAIGPLREPLFRRLVNRLNEWKKIVGVKLVSREERKEEKDLGLHGIKRGRTGKALQDGFPGNSGGTPGRE